MKIVKFRAHVDAAKCSGDKLCEAVCPTGAIQVVGKKAVVNGEKCVACSNCSDVCREEAVSLTPLARPVTISLDLNTVDQDELKALCRKARLHPQQLICLCTATRVGEAAAAILQGARSPADITLMTGACSGCTVFCVQPMLRLFKAHGVEPIFPKGRRWYNITPTLWDIPAQVVKKYSRYYLEEDREVFRKI